MPRLAAPDTTAFQTETLNTLKETASLSDEIFAAVESTLSVTGVAVQTVVTVEVDIKEIQPSGDDDHGDDDDDAGDHHDHDHEHDHDTSSSDADSANDGSGAASVGSLRSKYNLFQLSVFKWESLLISIFKFFFELYSHVESR